MPGEIVGKARDAPAFGASKNSSSLSLLIDSTIWIWYQETSVPLDVTLKIHLFVEIISIPITKIVGIVTTQ